VLLVTQLCFSSAGSKTSDAAAGNLLDRASAVFKSSAHSASER